MSGTRNELTEVRQALLGLAEEISNTLEKSATSLDEKLKQAAYFQSKLAALSMLGVSDSVDIQLKQRLAVALDKIITQSNHANLEAKQRLAGGLSNAANDVKEVITKPRAGRF